MSAQNVILSGAIASALLAVTGLAAMQERSVGNLGAFSLQQGSTAAQSFTSMAFAKVKQAVSDTTKAVSTATNEATSESTPKYTSAGSFNDPQPGIPAMAYEYALETPKGQTFTFRGVQYESTGNYGGLAVLSSSSGSGASASSTGEPGYVSSSVGSVSATEPFSSNGLSSTASSAPSTPQYTSVGSIADPQPGIPAMAYEYALEIPKGQTFTFRGVQYEATGNGGLSELSGSSATYGE
jgi:hypothetical protein